MTRRDYFNRLVMALIFIIVSYLFFANISWLNLNFINAHEIEFQVHSYRLAESFRSLNFSSFFSVVSSKTSHPLLPSLLIAVFKIIVSPLSLNEFLTIKAVYFICYLISLICVYRLSLLYAGGKKISSSIIALLYALSCPYYYQILFEGKAPEDLIANTFLFLCLYSYLRYRISLNRKSAAGIRWNAVLTSFLVVCCFFSKYNVGVFIAFSIIVDLLCACFILKRYSIKELKLSFIAVPACTIIIAWFVFCSGYSQFLSYVLLRARLGVNIIKPLYYLKLFFAQTGPFVHSINGIWEYKDELDMRYFYHWGQALIVLSCILPASISVIMDNRREKSNANHAFIIVPLLYIGINFLFFSFSGYYKPVALISTIPVAWLIAGRQFSMFFDTNKNMFARATARNIVRYSAGIIILVYVLVCAFLQYYQLNTQIASFVRYNDIKQLQEDADVAVSKIENFALENKCAYIFKPIQQGVSFFEEYITKLLRYRFSLKHRDRLKPEKNTLVMVALSLNAKRPFFYYVMRKIGYSRGSRIDFLFSGQTYVVDFYCLTPSQFKTGLTYFKYMHKRLKHRHHKGYFESMG